MGRKNNKRAAREARATRDFFAVTPSAVDSPPVSASSAAPPPPPPDVAGPPPPPPTIPGTRSFHPLNRAIEKGDAEGMRQAYDYVFTRGKELYLKYLADKELRREEIIAMFVLAYSYYDMGSKQIVWAIDTDIISLVADNIAEGKLLGLFINGTEKTGLQPSQIVIHAPAPLTEYDAASLIVDLILDLNMRWALNLKSQDFTCKNPYDYLPMIALGLIHMVAFGRHLDVSITPDKFLLVGITFFRFPKMEARNNLLVPETPALTEEEVDQIYHAIGKMAGKPYQPNLDGNPINPEKIFTYTEAGQVPRLDHKLGFRELDEESTDDHPVHHPSICDDPRRWSASNQGPQVACRSGASAAKASYRGTTSGNNPPGSLAGPSTGTGAGTGTMAGSASASATARPRGSLLFQDHATASSSSAPKATTGGGRPKKPTQGQIPLIDAKKDNAKPSGPGDATRRLHKHLAELLKIDYPSIHERRKALERARDDILKSDTLAAARAEQGIVPGPGGSSSASTSAQAQPKKKKELRRRPSLHHVDRTTLQTTHFQIGMDRGWLGELERMQAMAFVKNGEYKEMADATRKAFGDKYGYELKEAADAEKENPNDPKDKGKGKAKEYCRDEEAEGQTCVAKDKDKSSQASDYLRRKEEYFGAKAKGKKGKGKNKGRGKAKDESLPEPEVDNEKEEEPPVAGPSKKKAEPAPGKQYDGGNDSETSDMYGP
ncbi:hypothetical protein HRR90_004179 [Exophiala dermatitidis]|uniref:Uncharacterized protein n=2 Tax=Exophiala dermatitidis TaxID=5970 RepID=H6BU69_EXODN|nr:uncharacterized protein HMPREF1120_03776 [Exophiala dermatitidis NIH/UT8656]KAJ4506616.1 hypothetical protein HRR75_006858 [Exophiala dermatitidis]EHY55646.1 hypothetical protein HMPREF1120_03776 [Exophiala dermatitidis NIH/UT8656]KAJ4508891.1 hypothetical protein HRR74_007483 [Exophiala dermatitidis]KAJ4510143.1 hypothetical protein HRR73_006941 [Exophiala dermatitidis]KAJ4539149.1 hypothetical protein HRR77_006562 [Exophiala dermatitidis]